jgi:hypothetical protein
VEQRLDAKKEFTGKNRITGDRVADAINFTQLKQWAPFEIISGLCGVIATST